MLSRDPYTRFNRQRAERGARIMASYPLGEGAPRHPADAALVVADLAHWLRREGLDPERVVHEGLGHWRAEELEAATGEEQ